MIGKLFRHYKTRNVYRVTGYAHHTELEPQYRMMVLYVLKDSPPDMIPWARPWGGYGGWLTPVHEGMHHGDGKPCDCKRFEEVEE